MQKLERWLLDAGAWWEATSEADDSVKARHEDVYSAGGGTQLGSHAQLSRSDRDAVSYEYSAWAIGPECQNVPLAGRGTTLSLSN